MILPPTHRHRSPPKNFMRLNFSVANHHFFSPSTPPLSRSSPFQKKVESFMHDDVKENGWFSGNMAKGSHGNVAFIDVENYRLDDVIIIDDTECVTKKFHRPNVPTESRKSPSCIYVDDCSSDEDACSPSRTFPSSSRRHFLEVDGRQSRKKYAFFMGKCMRSNYGKTRARNHFGVHISSHSSSSDSDSSDCEVMEGSFEKLRQQWEEASLRRKHDVRRAYFTVDEQDKASASHGGDSDTNFDVENQMKHLSEVQACSSPENAENGGCCLLTELKSNSAEKGPVALAPLTVKDLICERERLKETDEYRRAMEEEWTTRQQELQIQAEEAQRLRRKRKAERMRLQDMQRRQMKRLEEVRETQKKDEENINLKEQLRVDVRKELSKLEMNCTDMASLLRGLGIQIGNGLQPSSQEVQAAYKRALLKFHPDRVSSADIRQLVEAEEKFKLISHMKKRFTC